MMDHYSRQWVLTVSDEVANAVFCDLETILRLGPQWNVKTLRMDGPMEPGRTFELDAEHDRSEELLSLSGRVKAFTPGKALHLLMECSQQTVDFSVRLEDREQGKLISFLVSTVPRPVLEDLREYDLWARSFVNYLKISQSRSPFSRIWKWVLDRWWLKMSQAGKRLVFFIVIGDAFSVIFLVAILLWWKYVAGP